MYRFQLTQEVDSRGTDPPKKSVRGRQGRERKFPDMLLLGKRERLRDAAFGRLMICFPVLRRHKQSKERVSRDESAPSAGGSRKLEGVPACPRGQGTGRMELVTAAQWPGAQS